MGISDITDVERLKKINTVLMSRVERSMDQQGNAFSLFQTAINLENRIRLRTEELRATLRRLEESNIDLVAAKDSAERANQSKTRFLAAASHDILQPLNAANLSISALAELQTSEEGKKLVGQVERSLETMEALLKTLLDISRLEAGVMRPDLSDVALAPLFFSLRSDFQPLAERLGLRLVFRPTQAVVRSDRTMLRRILQNIVSNALRYTARGGVLVGARPMGSTLRVDIVDTGQGIADDQSEAIFEEFHRGPVGAAGEGAEGGLGLGLAIVRSMASALAHPVWFRSRVGKGTVFHVELPLGAAKADAPALPIAPSAEDGRKPRLSGAKVLLLENDVRVRQAMSDLLSGWNCSVAEASTAREALESVSGTGWLPNLILADQHLDNGDLGTQVIEQLRDCIGTPVPAVMITADLSGEVAALARAAGVELMRKPVKPAQLRALIAHLLA